MHSEVVRRRDLAKSVMQLTSQCNLTNFLIHQIVNPDLKSKVPSQDDPNYTGSLDLAMGIFAEKSCRLRGIGENAHGQWTADILDRNSPNRIVSIVYGHNFILTTLASSLISLAYDYYLKNANTRNWQYYLYDRSRITSKNPDLLKQ